MIRKQAPLLNSRRRATVALLVAISLGALLATVDVTVPQDLNKNSKAKSALEDLRIATAGADPRADLLRRARQE